VFIGDLAKQLATALEDEAGDRSYDWETRRYYMRPLDKLKLGIMKRTVGISIGLRKATGHCEMKEEASKAQPSEKNKDNDGDTPGPARTLSGNHSGRAAFGREQREQLESNHGENRAMGKEGEADHRRHKYSPRKRINGGTPGM
jgi:hypothetical protein